MYLEKSCQAKNDERGVGMRLHLSKFRGTDRTDRRVSTTCCVAHCFFFLSARVPSEHHQGDQNSPVIWQLIQGRTLYPYEAGRGSFPMTPKGIYRKKASNTSVA